MKIMQTDTYPCGAAKEFPRFEFWGLGYAPSTGKPGCPTHGRKNCKKPEEHTLTPAQLEEARRILSEG